MDHIYVEHSGDNVSCVQSIRDVLVVTAKVHYIGFVSGLQGHGLLRTKCPLQDFYAGFRNFTHSGSAEIFDKS